MALLQHSLNPYVLLFLPDETFPGLEKGMAREEFETFVENMLRDWNIQPQFRERVMEAIEFQYTYWPEPDNRTARAQMFIDVSMVKLLVLLLSVVTASYR